MHTFLHTMRAGALLLALALCGLLGYVYSWPAALLSLLACFCVLLAAVADSGLTDAETLEYATAGEQQ